MSKLIIGGLGIKDLGQMTIETQRLCKEADEVFYLGTTPNLHIPLLKSWGINRIVSLFEMYVDGDIDESNYRRLFAAVRKMAAVNSLTVLLVPGHPRIGVTLVQWLEKSRSENPFELEVLAGVSSFETLLNDLARDPIEKGTVILDANRILLFKTRWDTSLDCYIYHVCSVGTSRVHLSDAKKENAWDRLKAHLLTIYPSDTRIELVSSLTSTSSAGLRVSSTLVNVDDLFMQVHFGTTLYIPGLKPTRLDKQFLDLLLKRELKNGRQSQIA